MAVISTKPKIELTATFVLSEDELRALDALAGYGDDAFLKVFYAGLGRAYLGPYEQGLKELFAAVRRYVPGMLEQARKAKLSLEQIVIQDQVPRVPCPTPKQAAVPVVSPSSEAGHAVSSAGQCDCDQCRMERENQKRRAGNGSEGR